MVGGKFEFLDDAMLSQAFRFFDKNNQSRVLTTQALADGIMDLRPHIDRDAVQAVLSAYSKVDLSRFKACYWQQSKDAFRSGRASRAVEDLQAAYAFFNTSQSGSLTLMEVRDTLCALFPQPDPIQSASCNQFVKELSDEFLSGASHGSIESFEFIQFLFTRELEATVYPVSVRTRRLLRSLDSIMAAPELDSSSCALQRQDSRGALRLNWARESAIQASGGQMTYLGWRSEAVAAMPTGSVPALQSLTQRIEETIASDTFRQPPPFACMNPPNLARFHSRDQVSSLSHSSVSDNCVLFIDQVVSSPDTAV